MTLSKTPLISVIMPVYNGKKFIREAINSVITQTYSNFELLVIDDSSTDKTLSVVRSFSDSRIKIISSKKHLGLVGIRNIGLQKTSGELIAFLDSDDIMAGDRLSFQMDFLKRNPHIVLVGSWVRVIDGLSRPTGPVWKHITDPSLIPSVLLFRNCLTQSSVMGKSREIKEIGFRESFSSAPDYDLWVRLAYRYKIANIPKVLSCYRLHSQNMSHSIKSSIHEADMENYKAQLSKMKISPTPDQLMTHGSFERQSKYSKKELRKVSEWLRTLVIANKKTCIYNRNNFNRIISRYWFKACMMAAYEGFDVINLWKNFIQSESLPFSFREKAALTVFCLFKKNIVVDVSSYSWQKVFGIYL